MKLLFPNSQRLNRGSYVLGELVKVCIANEVTDLIVLHEHRGESVTTLPPSPPSPPLPAPNYVILKILIIYF